jgi:hypothetical protein
MSVIIKNVELKDKVFMVAKTKANQKEKARSKRVVGEKSKPAIQAKSKAKTTATKSKSTEKVRVVNKITAPPISVKSSTRKLPKGPRLLPQYAFMKAPGLGHDFQVGDKVEVFCDHEKSKERIRGWVAGVVVQVDNKMVAVQFRSNVFLTDGWMVPDRILWYPLASEHIRAVAGGRKSVKREKAIPDY